MASLGDFDISSVIYGKFTTYQPSTGAAFTLGGTPALSVYKDNSTTQSTTGVTLTASFDSVTGLNHFAIDTSADGTFYSAGSFFDIVITTGTVDSVSVVGSVVARFTLRKTSSLKPTTAGRALDVSAGGEAGIDWANIGSPTTAVNLSATNIDVDQVVASVSGAVASVTGNVGGNVTGSVGSVASGGLSEASFATTAGAYAPLGIVDQGTAQSATGTTVVLRAASAFADDTLIGATIMVFGSTQGYWQSRAITDSVLSTDTVTVDTWTVTPSGTITYKIFGTAPSSGGSGPSAATIADAVWDELLSGHVVSGSAGEALSAAGTAGDPWTTALPGAYGSGTAGKIIGDNINATISSRATQTSVDDIPTNAELATALAAADDAVLAAIAALNNLSQANIRTAVGLGSANLDTQLGDLPTNAELATALGTADDAVLAAIAALNNLSQANIRTAVGLGSANLDTQLDALPTNAELATALGTADDAVLAAIAALNNLSAAQVNAEVLDVLNVDTFAQPSQGTPAATTSIRLMMAYLYKAWRNRSTQTASEYALYSDDATTKDHEAAVSDNGTTLDRGEVTTGA